MKRAHGYRSNFELDIANQLAKNNVAFDYEKDSIDYVRHSVYVPDFYIKDKDFYLLIEENIFLYRNSNQTLTLDFCS